MKVKFVNELSRRHLDYSEMEGCAPSLEDTRDRRAWLESCAELYRKHKELEAKQRNQK